MNYINGEWKGASFSTGEFVSLNPSDISDIVGTYQTSGEGDVKEAVKYASDAFRSWSKKSRIQRAEVLENFFKLAEQNIDELTYLVARESGKVLDEARADVVEGIHMAQFEFGKARQPFGDVVSSEIPEKDAFMLRKPKGVVAAITPWNFPFAIPIWLIAPSLLEGNTVVFKPSENTPAVGEVIVSLFERAGIPPGVLNLVQGDASTGKNLVNDNVNVILFTGSREAGTWIKKEIAGTSKMVAAEMGGKNALIVCEDADLDLAAKAAVLSAFRTSGQRCTSASRILVQRNVLNGFNKRFLSLVEKIKVGNALDKTVFMGPVINIEAMERIARYNSLAIKENAKVEIEYPFDFEPKVGYYIKPFVYQMEYSMLSRVLHEEVFGPHVAIIPFDTVERAIKINNSTPYGLSFSVITEDYRTAAKFRQECDFGVGYHNLPTIGAEVHLPFGGVKNSGTGMPSASTLIDVVTHRIAWTVNNSKIVKMAQGMSAEV